MNIYKIFVVEIIKSSNYQDWNEKKKNSRDWYYDDGLVLFTRSSSSCCCGWFMENIHRWKWKLKGFLTYKNLNFNMKFNGWMMCECIRYVDVYNTYIRFMNIHNASYISKMNMEQKLCVDRFRYSLDSRETMCIYGNNYLNWWFSGYVDLINLFFELEWGLANTTQLCVELLKKTFNNLYFV